jgi:hypothetical protein
MRKILFLILIAGAWLDGHAQSLPKCPEEKPFYEWSGCVGTYNLGENAQYVGEFAAGGPRGRGALISKKGYTLVEGRWFDGVTVDVDGRRWQYASNSDVSHVFVLMSSIKQEGAFRRAWVMHALAEKDGRLNNSLSYQELSKFDCGNERIELLQLTSFSEAWGGGDVTGRLGKEKWEYFLPGSVYAEVAKYVCNYKLAKNKTTPGLPR